MGKHWITWLLLGLSVILNAVLLVSIYGYLSSHGGLTFLLGRTKLVDNFYAPDRPAKQAIELFNGLPKIDNAIVFIGDDHVANGPWDEMFPNSRIARRGLAGETSLGVVGRINDILPQHPSAIFIMVGFNDILAGVHPITISSNYHRLFDAVESLSPSTRVYVMSILPYAGAKRASQAERHQAIIETNRKLAEISAQRGVEFIDLYPAFITTQKNQLKPELASDWRALSAAGYQLWRNLILEKVRDNTVVSRDDQAVEP